MDWFPIMMDESSIMKDEVIKVINMLPFPPWLKVIISSLYVLVLVIKSMQTIRKVIDSQWYYQKAEYPFGDNRLLDRLRHVQELVDSESAIRTRSNRQREKLNRTESVLFAKGLGLGFLLSLMDAGLWLACLALFLEVNWKEVLTLGTTVIILFVMVALVELSDRPTGAIKINKINTGLWIFTLCMTGLAQFIALVSVTMEKLSRNYVATSVLAAVACAFQVFCILFWHMFIRSHYDVRPFKAGFPFTQTGFSSWLSAGNHCRRAREVYGKKEWNDGSGLLYEQRLLYPYQFNVIDSFTWEGQDVHFLDATIGRPPWQNPEWHFQQVARLERMSDKCGEENIEHRYGQPRHATEFVNLCCSIMNIEHKYGLCRYATEFVNLCCSIMKLPLRSDDTEAETSNDANTIVRYVEEYLKEYRPRRDDYILCFSHNGISSMLVTLQLLQLGYEHTYDLGECAIRYPLINVKAQELTMLSMLAQEEDPGKILM